MRTDRRTFRASRQPDQEQFLEHIVDCGAADEAKDSCEQSSAQQAARTLAVFELKYENEDRNEEAGGQPERNAAADDAAREDEAKKKRREDAPVIAQMDFREASLRECACA